MIKLKIENCLTEEDIRLMKETNRDEIYGVILEFKPYDTEKWMDGRIYEFNTLKEVVEFINTCDVGFTDESHNSFGYCDGYDLQLEYRIDTSEDNLIVFSLDVERYARD